MVIPKLDGAIQLCIDFLKVNTFLVFVAFPMPHVEEMIEQIGHAKFISTLDLTKGYWQIPMAKADKEKMAFNTP